jgi:hypothetical protein
MTRVPRQPHTMCPPASRRHSVRAQRQLYSSPLSIASAAMTGLTDLVVLLVIDLYGKIQEHEPLPTVILALVSNSRTRIANPLLALINVLSPSPQLVHRYFQKYEPQSPGICAFLLLILPGVVSGAFVRGASSFFRPSPPPHMPSFTRRWLCRSFPTGCRPFIRWRDTLALCWPKYLSFGL